MLGPNAVLDGFSILHKADCVSYFKPALARRLCVKYLSEFKTVFCPFNGFSGIMLGCVVGCGKNFIGQDLNATQIRESLKIADFVKRGGTTADISLSVKDVFEDSGEYECLMCCPPYRRLEQWNFRNGECIDRDLTCDQWIDECLARYKCGRYLFVVDDAIEKYTPHVVETLVNRSHFGHNREFVVELDFDDRGKYVQ